MRIVCYDIINDKFMSHKIQNFRETLYNDKKYTSMKRNLKLNLSYHSQEVTYKLLFFYNISAFYVS